MTTLQDMREHVRTYLDLDEEDLPDVIFDEFVEEGTSKILEREANWPFLETSAQVTPIVGQGTYDTATTVPNIEFLTGISRDVETSLTPVDLVWTSYKQRNDWPTWGQTVAWTEYGGQIHLYPAPITDDALTISGTLKVSGWTDGGPGASPPLPEPFHGVILKWALAATYFQQDDPDNGVVHANQFDQRLETLWRKYMTSPRTAGLKIASVKGRPLYPAYTLPDGF